MPMSLKDKYAIVGIGYTDQGGFQEGQLSAFMSRPVPTQSRSTSCDSRNARIASIFAGHHPSFARYAIRMIPSG